MAAAVALLVLAAATLGAPSGMGLFEGLSDGSRVQQAFLGPEPAQAESVAEVVRIAQRALRSARFVSGDFAVWRGDPGDEPHFVSTVHVILAADGSRRVTANLGRMAWEVTYDAATGVSRVWSASFGPEPSVRIETEERAVGTPPGEPDGGRSLADFSLPVTNGVGWQLFGSVARIARAGTGGSAATGVFDGRPVWIVTCPVMLRAPGERGAETTAAAGDSDAAERRLSVSVDQRSGLPVRIQSWVDGELTAELRLQNVKVDGLVADGVFAPGPPRAARVTTGDDGRLALSVDLGTSTTTMPLPFDPETVSPEDVRVSIADEAATEEDLGFRRTSIDEVPAATGRAALVPTWLPDGFHLRCVVVRNEPGSLRAFERPRRPGAGRWRGRHAALRVRLRGDHGHDPQARPASRARSVRTRPGPVHRRQLAGMDRRADRRQADRRRAGGWQVPGGGRAADDPAPVGGQGRHAPDRRRRRLGQRAARDRRLDRAAGGDRRSTAAGVQPTAE